MKKRFRCLVCGYVYEGENPPAECPICHAKADKFAEIKEDEGNFPYYIIILNAFIKVQTCKYPTMRYISADEVGIFGCDSIHTLL